MVDGERPSCPRGCSGRVHRHGRYFRYAHPSGTKTFAVQRFRCPRCGLTISVLPVDRLPYRSLVVPRVEAFFNEQARTGSGPDPPPGEVEAGCLRRAWTRLQGRTDVLRQLPGLKAANGAVSAAAVWTQLCNDHGTLSAVLCSLARWQRQSLLGDYGCLRVPA